MDKVRSLFPAVELQIDHVGRKASFDTRFSPFDQGRLSLGHQTLPYGLAVCFTSMSSQLSSVTPSRNAPKLDLMTLIYQMSFRHLRIEFFPIESYTGVDREA